MKFLLKFFVKVLTFTFSFTTCHLVHNRFLIIFHMVVIAISLVVVMEKLKTILIQHVAEIMVAENVPKWILTAHGIALILSMDGNKVLKMESFVVSVQIQAGIYGMFRLRQKISNLVRSIKFDFWFWPGLKMKIVLF